MRGLLLRCPDDGWAESAFSSLLPGGHALVQGRHRVAMTAEQVGFEVRDCIAVQGFRVQHRIWLFRKPLVESTVAKQVLKTGTGAIWIDGCRVDAAGAVLGRANKPGPNGWKNSSGGHNRAMSDPIAAAGRWPPNIVFIHGPECRRDGTAEAKRNET